MVLFGDWDPKNSHSSAIFGGLRASARDVFFVEFRCMGISTNLKTGTFPASPLSIVSLTVVEDSNVSLSYYRYRQLRRLESTAADKLLKVSPAAWPIVCWVQ